MHRSGQARPAVRMVADRTVRAAAGFKGITAHIDQHGVSRLQVDAGGSHRCVEFVGFDRRVHPGPPRSAVISRQMPRVDMPVAAPISMSAEPSGPGAVLGCPLCQRPSNPTCVSPSRCVCSQAVAVDLDTVRTRRMAAQRRPRERFHHERRPRLISADGSARLQRPGQRKALPLAHRRRAAQPRLWRDIAQRSVTGLIVLDLSQVLVGEPLNPVRDGVHACAPTGAASPIMPTSRALIWMARTFDISRHWTKLPPMIHRPG